MGRKGGRRGEEGGRNVERGKEKGGRRGQNGVRIEGEEKTADERVIKEQEGSKNEGKLK